MSRIGSGTLLAGRYRLDRRSGPDTPDSTWAAHDLTLDRPVAVRVLEAEGSRVQTTLDAARRAALVDDARLQRVIGVGVEASQGYGYVVLERLEGRRVRELAGRVDAGEAVRIIREAALGLQSAARRGLHHGHLDPGAVVRTSAGRVRVEGVAVDTAFREGAGSRAQQQTEGQDARGLTALLYALITGHWPFEDDVGLPAAPLDEGRPATPESLRPGTDPRYGELVHRLVTARPSRSLAELLADLDSLPPAPEPTEIADDLEDDSDTETIPVVAPPQTSRLNSTGANQPRRLQPVAAQSSADSARDVLRTAMGRDQAPPRDDGWSLLPVDDSWAFDDQAGASRDRVDDDPFAGSRGVAGRASASGAAPLLPAGAVAAGEARRRRTSGAGTGVLVVLVVAAFVVGGLVWALDRFQAEVPVAQPSAPPVVQEAPTEVAPPVEVAPVEPPPPDVRVVTPAGAQALDPFGDGEENNQAATRAIDRDPATAWTTVSYNSQDFGGLKEGVGVALDLGAPEEVLSVQVTAGGEGGAYEVRSASSPSFEGSVVIGTAGTDPTGAAATIAPETGVTTQFLVVWFTQLPDDGGDWRALLNEVQVQVR